MSKKSTTFDTRPRVPYALLSTSAAALFQVRLLIQIISAVLGLAKLNTLGPVRSPFHNAHTQESSVVVALVIVKLEL
jgi:hypothetical protein